MFLTTRTGPKVTCETCGQEYTDYAGWSGPVHSHGDCIETLRSRIRDLEADLAETMAGADKAEASLGAVAAAMNERQRQAREAGVTFEAVRDIVNRYAAEEATFARTVEDLRDLVNAAVASLTSDGALGDEMARRVALWSAIDAFARACGGDPSKRVYGNVERQRAVAAVECVVFGGGST